MIKKRLTEYYRAVLLDWILSGFEVQDFETLEEAVKHAREVLNSSAYGHLYSSVLIEFHKKLSDHECEVDEVLVVEKQPETWKIVEIEAKDFNEKSLYRYGDLKEYKQEIARRRKLAQAEIAQAQAVK